MVDSQDINSIIGDFYLKWKIKKAYLFGSILRKDFHDQSDVDILVEFEQNTSWSLFDMAEMQADLESRLKRKVDLISKAAIERSTNWIRREEILETAQLIYEKQRSSIIT